MLVIHTLELPKLLPLDAAAGNPHDPLVVFSRFLTARSRAALATLADEEPAMKQALDILEHLSADATARRLAADREARRRLDDMYRRDELAEAKEEARAEGEAIGVAKGEALARSTLAQLLELRFGRLDDTHARALQAASYAQLERWLACVPVAASLDELFAG